MNEFSPVIHAFAVRVGFYVYVHLECFGLLFSTANFYSIKTVTLKGSISSSNDIYLTGYVNTLIIQLLLKLGPKLSCIFLHFNLHTFVLHS